MELRMGNKVRDKATGLTGYIDSKREMLDGNVQWSVRPPVNEKNEMSKGWYMDPFMLEFLEEGFASSLPPVDSSVTIKLGDEVENIISGFRGIATEKHTSQNGCVEFWVVGKYNTTECKTPTDLCLHTKLRQIKPQVQPAPQAARHSGARMEESPRR